MWKCNQDSSMEFKNFYHIWSPNLFTSSFYVMQSSLILSIQFRLSVTTWNLSSKCWRWNLKQYIFRGLIKAGLCRTLLHIKIRQKLKSTTAQPELLGNNFWFLFSNHWMLKSIVCMFFCCLRCEFGLIGDSASDSLRSGPNQLPRQTSC